MASSGMLRRVALVRTDVSGELSASFTLHSMRQLLVAASVVPSSPILVTLIKEALSSSDRFLQEPHDVTSHKTFCSRGVTRTTKEQLHY
jgi:hypothetical protein